MSQTILITGSSSGFGKDAALAFVALGHTVFATMRGVDDKNKDKAEALKAEAGKLGKGTLHVVELDVASNESVDAAIRNVLSLSGDKLDVVIQNAGIGVWGVAESYSADQFESVLQVNVIGVHRVNNAVLPTLRKQKSGHIIYISSGLGRMVLPNMALYNASKFALEGYAETLSYELNAQGIATTIVQPGAFGTGFLGNTIKAANSQVFDEYDGTKPFINAMAANFETAAKEGKMADPVAVKDALVGLVTGQPLAERPLRLPVGDDFKAACDAINNVASQTTAGAYKHMQLDSLLKVKQ